MPHCSAVLSILHRVRRHCKVRWHNGGILNQIDYMGKLFALDAKETPTMWARMAQLKKKGLHRVRWCCKVRWDNGGILKQTYNICKLLAFNAKETSEMFNTHMYVYVRRKLHNTYAIVKKWNLLLTHTVRTRSGVTMLGKSFVHLTWKRIVIRVRHLYKL